MTRSISQHYESIGNRMADPVSAFAESAAQLYEKWMKESNIVVPPRQLHSNDTPVTKMCKISMSMPSTFQPQSSCNPSGFRANDPALCSQSQPSSTSSYLQKSMYYSLFYIGILICLFLNRLVKSRLIHLE
jgi:hypothetical protein